MNDSHTQGLRAIAEQAADWYLRIEEEGGVPLTVRQAFVHWLKASPTHIEEFMRVRATHAQLTGMDVSELPDVDALLQQARSNVIALTQAPGDSALHETRSPRKSIPWATAASLLITALLLGLFAAMPPDSINDEAVTGSFYETALGEQRSVLLSDGSVVELNTLSKLRVEFRDDARLVELVAGEAVFEVAKDPMRPFRVDAGAAFVKAVGTRFNVYRQSAQTIVTVVEGRVEVSRPPTVPTSPNSEAAGEIAQLPIVELVPGDQVAVTAGGLISAPAVVDTNKAIAWTDRRLVFDGDNLASVARELNRYNREQLVIADPELAEEPISGVFYANDPDTLFAFLEAVGGMRVETDANGWTLYPATGTD